MATVSLRQVSKVFGQRRDGMRREVRAVDDVSLTLADGEVLGVLGPSGCGKSTFLRLIAGLETPDAGEILFDNQPLQEIDIRERGIGMVFQTGALMPHWEGWRTVGLFMSLRKRDGKCRNACVRWRRLRVLESRICWRNGRSSSPAGKCSGWASPVPWRATRACSSLTSPSPAWTQKSAARARVELKRLLNAFPVTSAYVTHDQAEAIALAPRIAVMRDGRFEQIGTWRELYDNPATRFVGGFIGTPLMNEFHGRATDGRWQGRSFGGYPIRGDLERGALITLGIRPERLRLVAEGGIPAEVAQVTPFFAERYQLLELRQGRESWRMTVPLDTQVTVGSRVHCEPDPTGIHYFDTLRGQRVG